MSKKPSFKDCSRDWLDNLIERMFEKIDLEKCDAAAIGLDMAAQEDNWGLCLLTLDANYKQGALRLLLPHRATIDGFNQFCPVKPTLAYLRDLLVGLRQRKIKTAFAVDVPLGWPESHGDFTNEWSAMKGTTTTLPTRHEFEYRMTDLRLKEKLRANLFAVGADKIASAAFQWAKARTELGGLINACDVGLGIKQHSLVTLFETYPGAFIRLNYGDWVKYKTGDITIEQSDSQPVTEMLRKPLLDRIRQDYSIDTALCGDHLRLSCTSARSDAFDGFLSALTAWDYLRWQKYGTQSHETTTPAALLEREPTAEEIKRIGFEGWILTRMSPLADISGLAATLVNEVTNAES